MTILEQGEHLKKVITKIRGRGYKRVFVVSERRDFYTTVNPLIKKMTGIEVNVFNSVKGYPVVFIEGGDIFYNAKN
jgi:hypothetical protein